MTVHLKFVKIYIFEVLPSGLSKVFEGVLTTGSEERCLPPRRKPVDDVSTSDITPGSSSKSKALFGGGYRGRGG